MANNKSHALFKEFPDTTTEEWEEVIKADLRGADYEKCLAWRTEEGFTLRPYYRQEDNVNLKHLKADVGEFPFVRSIGDNNNWIIYERVFVADPKSANTLAQSKIGVGVEGINFHLTEQIDASGVAALLSKINLQEIELTFSSSTTQVAISTAKLVVAEAKKQKLDPKTTRINFVIDPLITDLSLGGELDEDIFGQIAKLIKDGKESFVRFRFVGVGGDWFGNSGSTIVEQLAFSLAVGYDYVVRLLEHGLSIEKASCSLRFSLSITSNYFMEIAKLRAARMLWATIIKQHEPKCDAAMKMLIHSVSSKWSFTDYDPHVNMLRATTEAMSAAIGGVHSMSLLPYSATYEAPTEFSSRIARNTQLLLKHESHFDNVVDAGGGSYYIENLTDSIATAAWDLFKEIEGQGGYTAAFKSGKIVERVEASAQKKRDAIATRRKTLLGTNQYPNFDEVTPKAKGCSCSATKQLRNTLKPSRGSDAFETLRTTVDQSGREIKAFMLTVGTLSMARARSQFSSNFFACGGFRIEDNNFFHSVEQGVKAAMQSKADVVVLCAADDDYATLAPKVKELLGDRAILVIAGAPASRLELEQQGITNFISIRSNVLDTLKFYLKELGFEV